VWTQLASSPPFLLPGAVSPLSDIVTPCHTYFSLSQVELDVSALSFDNASSRFLPSRAETEVLNPHHHRSRPTSSDSLTYSIYCYKNVISILVTLPTTQPRLHFASSLTRVPRHSSSTRLIIHFHRRLTPIVT
jgi:hypothetical protein